MQPNVFLSRHIDQDSPFSALVKSGQIKLLAESLLVFSPVLFHAIPEGDWLFFYSKSGVKYFLSQLSNLESISSYKIACYGPSTAKIWTKMTTSEPQFIGDGKPSHVPSAFIESMNKGDVVVFVRAANSKMTVQRAIEHQVDCRDMIAYRNEQRQDVDIQGHFDCALLTSPLNADAFLQQAADFIGDIITLGSTTADFINQNYNQDCMISEDVTEMGLYLSFQNWMRGRGGGSLRSSYKS